MKKTIVLFISLLMVFALAGCSLNKEETKPTESCNCNEPTEKPTAIETPKYMHIFTYENGFKGYDMYAFLNNQGQELQVFDYKGELYLSEGDSSACVFAAFEGKAKFTNYEYECNEAMDNPAVLTQTGIKTNTVNSVKIINSCRSDGAPFVLFVNKDGKVTYFNNIEGSHELKNDYFSGNSVKDVIDFRCENQQEAGYNDSVFTLLLEDGQTKEVVK